MVIFMLDVGNIVTGGAVKAFAKVKSLFLLFDGEVRVVWESAWNSVTWQKG
jgi:hypothetical protein